MKALRTYRRACIALILCMAFTLVPLPGTALPAEAEAQIPLFQTTDGLAVFEAESAYYNPSVFSVVTGSDLSGGKGVYTSAGGLKPDVSETSNLEFQVKADHTGTYALWLRVKPTTPNKSIYVSVNGEDYASVALKGEKDKCHWIRVASTYRIEQGSTITYKLSPNGGYFTVDKVLVTSQRFMHPDGIDGTLIEDDTTLPDGVYNTPSFTPPPQHPRLYFMQDDIPQILANAKKTENLLAWNQHQANLTKDTGTDGFLPVAEPDKSNNNNTWLGWFESWAFEYATNGNEELGRKAIDNIKNFAESVVYIEPNYDGYTRNAGHLIFTIAEVYDWCYPLLTQEDKNYLIEQSIAIISDGIEVGWPPTRQGALTGHGSEAQTLRDLLSFSIAVYDERPDIYNMVAGRFFDEFLPARQYHYTSHMFHQGSGYGSYRGQWDYNSTWIFDRMGLPRVYGDDQQYTGYWFLYMMRPDGVPFTDGDASNNGRTPGTNYTGYRRIHFLNSSYYKDPYLKQAALQNGSGSSFGYGHGNTSPVEFLIFNDPDLAGKPLSELPLTRYFGSPMGHMMARTSWEDGLDSNAVVAQMKVGELWFANHHHLDSGHFQIYYKGLLAGDSGRYESYGNAHDGAYNKRTVAHNTMLVYDPSENMSYFGNVNDGGQRIAGGEQSTIANLLSKNYKFGEVQGHEFGPDPLEPDYTYLKGDLTQAYSTSKMSDFDRSFLFYNLKDDTHPAAMIVFDRVVSTNATFKKSWLLHGVAEPTVNGNQTVFRNDTLGYNGKLTVDTLMPAAENTKIEVIGGLNNDFWVNGVNYPSTNKDGVSNPPNLDKIHDTDGYRIEVSPKTPATTDYFLNVLQVGESNPDTPALPVQKIETTTHAGVQVADRVAVFSKNDGRTSQPVTFRFTGSGIFKINVADVYAGTWSIQKDGVNMGSVTATQEGGLLTFEGGAGSYTLTYNSGAQDVSLPITISNMRAQTVSGALTISADVAGASENAYVMLALYDANGNMTYIDQTNYVGQKTYAFALPAGSVDAKQAMLFVWSDVYGALPLSSTQKIAL